MDYKIFQLLHQFAGRLAILDLLAVFLAQYLPYFLLLFFILLLFGKLRYGTDKWLKRLHCIFLAVLALLISRGLIVSALRFFWPRPRPFVVLNFQPLVDHPVTAAFPSAHAVIYFVLATIAYFIDRRWGIYFFIAAALNALARVFVGVHWPSDVVAGALLGIVVVLVLRRLLPKPTP